MIESSEANFFALPSGDDLRVFLSQESITPSTLRKMLRRRGVFVASNDKKDMLEHILLSFLEPGEFALLLEEAKTRQDSEKVRSRHKAVIDGVQGIQDLIPADFDFNALLSDEFGNSKPVGAPQFVIDQANATATVSFEIERTSFSADWHRARRVFRCEMRLKLDQDKNLSVTLLHTAPETEAALRRVYRGYENFLKDQGLLASSQPFVDSIAFDSFTNAERIAFLMEFTGLNDPESITFDKITGIALKLDKNSDPPDEERLNWMKASIRKVELSGELQDTFFLQDHACRPYLLVWRMEARFDFISRDSVGHFDAIFEFSDYHTLGPKDSEFQISIPTLTWDGDSRKGGQLSELKRMLSLSLNKHKLQFFRKATALQRPPMPALAV